MSTEGIIAIIVSVLIFVFVLIFIFRKTKRGIKKENLTEHAVGILKNKRRTGLSINDQPQMELTFDAILKDGGLKEVTVYEIVPLTDLHLLETGTGMAIVYDPETSKGRLDKNFNEEDVQDAYDRYLARLNPRGYTYEERKRLRTMGVHKKAIITDIRFTGNVDKDLHEVTITIRIDEKFQKERFLTRTSYMRDIELENIAIGKIVDVTIVEDTNPWFSINQKIKGYGAI